MSSASKSPTFDRVIICGSMSSYADMLNQRQALQAAGIRAILPDPDDDPALSLSEDELQEAKRRSSMRHIRRIRDKKTFGILVVNCDRYGLADYIGANTFAEISVAFSHYKRIYLYQGIPEFYRDELCAWTVVCLNGFLGRLIDDFRRTSIAETSQLRLFD
jgi:hypothetical protein